MLMSIKKKLKLQITNYLKNKKGKKVIGPRWCLKIFKLVHLNLIAIKKLLQSMNGFLLYLFLSVNQNPLS